MLNLGTGELLVIFLVALIVLGPNKLPDAARQMGKMAAELRRLSSGFQEEMREAMREPAPTLPPPVPLALEEPEPAPAPEPPSTPKARTTTPRKRREPLRAAEPASAEQQLRD